MLRKLFDKYEPHFHEGGKWEKYYALYEAIDTGLFKPSDTTQNSSHVRDNIDLKRVMITVWVATFPTLSSGCGTLDFKQIPSWLRWGWFLRKVSVEYLSDS